MQPHISLQRLAPIYGLSKSRLGQIAQRGVDVADVEAVWKYVEGTAIRTTLFETLCRDINRGRIRHQISHLKNKVKP